MVLFLGRGPPGGEQDLNWAGKSGILTEAQLAEPEKSRYPTGIGGNSASASKIEFKNRGGFYESFPNFLKASA